MTGVRVLSTRLRISAKGQHFTDVKLDSRTRTLESFLLGVPGGGDTRSKRPDSNPPKHGRNAPRLPWDGFGFPPEHSLVRRSLACYDALG